MTPKQATRVALFYLEEAVLDVLNAAPEEGLYLSEIAAQTAEPGQGFNSITTGCLQRLQGRGLVEQPAGKKGTRWTITEAGRETR